MQECPASFNKPLYYRKYVDDTFLIFKDDTHIPLFLKYLNSKHKNIIFTHEIENNGSIPFLVVLCSELGMVQLSQYIVNLHLLV